MSLILDALRRGRGRSAPGANPNAAQTDAVLHTLGYGRFNPGTPFNRLKRLFGFLAIAAVAAIALWGSVVWITQASFTPAAPELQTPAPVVTTQADPIAAGAPVLVPDTTTANPPAPNAPNAPIAPNAPSAPNAPNGAPNVPRATANVVVPSQRLTVPSSAAAAPTGAPTRTVLSTSAGTNGATVTVGDDYFRRAMMFQRLGDFENALVSYKQVLQRDDLNVEAHNNLGVLYRDKGLLEDAIKHFQRAIAINPAYARGRNNLGVVFLNQRKFDMAANQFHAALAIDPKNVESMVNLSTVEKELGRRDAARSWLIRALDVDPRNPEAHYNVGLLEDESGNRTQALVHYRAFLQHGAAIHPALVGDVRQRIADLESKN
jgi:Tfp pilus assembly protein PilF